MIHADQDHSDSHTIPFMQINVTGYPGMDLSGIPNLCASDASSGKRAFVLAATQSASQTTHLSELKQQLLLLRMHAWLLLGILTENHL